MSIETSDPRLTSYALGEMTDDERRAFEAELTTSETAQREVAEIAALGEVLRQELGARSPASITLAQREAIEQALRARPRGPAPEPAAAEKSATIVPLRRWRLARVLVLLAPAAALTAGALTFAVKSERSDGQAKPPYAESPHQLASDAVPAPPAATAAPGESLAPRVDQGPMSKGAAIRPYAPPAASAASAALPENPFVKVAVDPRSTFSIDVDTASYSLVRRILESGAMPPAGIVRVEEMINYFRYDYEPPNDAAFSVSTDVTEAPWDRKHRLFRVGLRGRSVELAARPPSNLVFLVDVSGSMSGPDRLPLVKQSLRMLVEQLDERDRIAIAVYAGKSGLVLPSTPGSDRRTILGAIDRLESGGSTNGGEGIRLAYAEAARGFVKGGTNRVLLATDGDFNVGLTSPGELVGLVQEKAKTGVFLTVLGFGMNNLQDGMLESLADKGNGNYAYIDSLAEARKVLVEQASGTLLTIAKDVKIQITFDPKSVESFRLIGYENRVLAHRDFSDDKKDAGEIGAGHTVTALYEVVPNGGGAHLADVALRYKMPDGDKSRLVEHVVRDGGARFEAASADLRFAASVAAFGMLLRGSKNVGDLGYAGVANMAEGSLGSDAEGHRRGFVSLVRRAAELAPK